MTDNRVIEFAPIKGCRATGTIIVPELLGLLKDKEPLKPGQRCFRVITAKDGDKRVGGIPVTSLRSMRRRPSSIS